MSLDLTARQRQYLEAMELGPVWRLRHRAGASDVLDPLAAIAAAIDPEAATTAQAVAQAIPVTGYDAPHGGQAGRRAALADDDRAAAWAALGRTVATCQACGLCRQRKQAVLGVGDLRPDLLLIGEGPGAEEDQRGEPFVGQAGKLLDAMLHAIGLERGKGVYIANAVKCRPPGNRTPEADEMAACRPYLEQQIALLQPRLILLLGRAAAHTILGDDRALAALRGKRFAYGDIPVWVTYHPAYLLRNLPDKAKAWEDLCRVRRALAAS